jgi:hypothetical protein
MTRQCLPNALTDLPISQKHWEIDFVRLLQRLGLPVVYQLALLLEAAAEVELAVWVVGNAALVERFVQVLQVWLSLDS